MNELIVKDADNYILIPKATIELIELETLEKKVKEGKKILRDKIQKEMEAKGIKKIDMPELSITYKFASDKETFNKDKFQEEYPELYDDYVEMKPTASSIMVKVK